MSAPGTTPITVERTIALDGPHDRPTQAVAGAAALAAVVIAVWSLRRLPPARLALLIVLRTVAVAAALVLVLRPTLRREQVARTPNRIAVLVDASGSMALADHPGEPTRWQRTQKYLAALDSHLRGQAVDYYQVGGALRPTSSTALAAAPPSDDDTKLGEALAELRKRYDGHDLGAVVLISDGIDRGRLAQGAGAGISSGGSEAARLAALVDAPLHTVWAGQPGLRDLAIADLRVDDFAFARTVVRIEATLHVSDAAAWAGQVVPVTLSQLDDGREIAALSIPLQKGQHDYPLKFELSPERLGKFLFEIATPVLPDEAVAENNRRLFVLKVVRDKIRVLQVAGRPSWDERFLRGMLKRNPNVDLISFFILRNHGDIDDASPDEMSLIPFPTDELFGHQLPSFDVVFLQNFNYEPYGMGQYLDEIRKYVEGGGALVMTGGDLSFASGGYTNTPIAEVLPVELPSGPAVPIFFDDTPASTASLVDLRPFGLSLTPEGAAHPITALEFDPLENRTRWSQLPQLEGANLVLRPKPGAVVLGVHPTLRDSDGKPLPVLTVSDMGQGRVLALASDSSWRWGFGDRAAGGTGRAFQRFWENAMAWLTHDPALSWLRIEADHSEYAPGQTIKLDARTLGPDYGPLAGADVSLRVERIGEKPVKVAEKSGRTDDDGRLRVELTASEGGGYHVHAEAKTEGRTATADEVFLVRAHQHELEQPEARDDYLRALASASSTTTGSFRTLDDGPFLPTLGPPREVRVLEGATELWSSSVVLIIAALALSLYWLLRRRWGYR